MRAQGNALEGQEAGTAGTAGSGALSGYQAMYANPGYTAAQQSAITNSTEQGVGAAAGAASQQAANAAARSGNSAGLTSNLDALARQRMITSGNLAANNQVTFANDAQKQQEQALQGMQGLYGTATGGVNSTLGILNNSANQPNAFSQALGSSVGKSLGTFGGSFGGGGAPSFGFGT